MEGRIANPCLSSTNRIILDQGSTTCSVKRKTSKTWPWVLSWNSHQFGQIASLLALESVRLYWFRWDRKDWFQWALHDLQVQVQKLLQDPSKKSRERRQEHRNLGPWHLQHQFILNWQTSSSPQQNWKILHLLQKSPRDNSRYHTQPRSRRIQTLLHLWITMII